MRAPRVAAFLAVALIFSGALSAQAYERNQVLLTVDLADNTPVSVTIDGTKLGDFQAYLRLDIRRFVHRGRNTLRVRAAGHGVYGRVAIGFTHRHADYRELAHIGDAARLDYTHDRTVTFDLPQR